MTNLRHLSFSPQRFKGFCEGSGHSQTGSPVTIKDPIQWVTIRHEKDALHIQKIQSFRQPQMQKSQIWFQQICCHRKLSHCFKVTFPHRVQSSENSPSKTVSSSQRRVPLPCIRKKTYCSMLLKWYKIIISIYSISANAGIYVIL